MRLHDYHPVTGEYQGGRTARLDPEEARLGVVRYLLPAYATFTAPPETGENEAAVFDPAAQTWRIVPDHRGAVHYDPATGARLVVADLGVVPGVVEAPPAGLYKPVWNGSAWTEGEDQAVIRRSVETRIVSLRRAAADAEGLTIQADYQAQLAAAEAELAALSD